MINEQNLWESSIKNNIPHESFTYYAFIGDLIFKEDS